MKRSLQLSWNNFAICVLPLNIIPVLLVAASVSDEGSWLGAAVVLSVSVSLSVFLGCGWARLRRANAASPISGTDIAQILKHLLGPPVPAVIWLGLTFLLPFALIAIWLLTRAA